MTEVVKVCKVHGELTREQVHKNRTSYLCAACKKIIFREYYLKNKLKLLTNRDENRKKNLKRENEYRKVLRLRNYDKFRQREKEQAKHCCSGGKYNTQARVRGNRYRQKHLDIIIAKQRIRTTSEVVNLGNNYMKQLIAGEWEIPRKNISPKLIEYKRVLLTLKRKLKDIRKNEN